MYHSTSDTYFFSGSAQFLEDCILSAFAHRDKDGLVTDSIYISYDLHSLLVQLYEGPVESYITNSGGLAWLHRVEGSNFLLVGKNGDYDKHIDRVITAAIEKHCLTD
jgi:hypothetical protein